MQKDAWNCFWDICEKSNGNWAMWKDSEDGGIDDGCWPGMFDDFAEFMKKN